MSEIIRSIEAAQLRTDLPKITVGDTVRVWVKVVEGSRERLQAFEGTVIAMRNGGVRETFTVRRVSYGIGVERTFPIHSPRVDHVEIIRHGKVRRAKLYYLRSLQGKAAAIQIRLIGLVDRLSRRLQQPIEQGKIRGINAVGGYFHRLPDLLLQILPPEQLSGIESVIASLHQFLPLFRFRPGQLQPPEQQPSNAMPTKGRSSPNSSSYTIRASTSHWLPLLASYIPVQS